MLEPYAVKVACTVLRGEMKGGGLLTYPTSYSLCGRTPCMRTVCANKKNKTENMQETISKIDDIKKTVSKGDLELAFNDLSNLLSVIDFVRKDKLIQLEKDFILVSAKFNEDKNERLKGTIDQELLIRNYSNQIISFLHILETLKNIAQGKSNDKINSKKESISISFWNKTFLDNDSPFTRDYSNRYQEFPIINKTNLSQKTIKEICLKLSSRLDNKENIWVDKGDEDTFGKIYTNTSVLYFWLQLGFDLNHEICRRAVSYIDNVSEIAIDNRAKFYFDIQTDRITKNNALKFLQLLDSHQIKSPRRNSGGFVPFRQGSRGTVDSPNKIPTHYGGFTFHACLIADVLLHLNTSSQSLLNEATKILNRIRFFLIKMNEENNGFLVDGNFEKSPQFTTWFYALSKGLILELPQNWEENIIEILKMKHDSMFKSSLLMMNLSLILMRLKEKLSSSTQQKIFNRFGFYFDELKDYMNSNREISSRDLSLYGRSLIYINQALGNNLLKIRNEIMNEICAE